MDRMTFQTFATIHDIPLSKEGKNSVISGISTIIENYKNEEGPGVIEDLPRNREEIARDIYRECGDSDNVGELRACLIDSFDISYGNAGSAVTMVSDNIGEIMSKSMTTEEEKEEREERISESEGIYR